MDIVSGHLRLVFVNFEINRSLHRRLKSVLQTVEFSVGKPN